MRVLYKQRNIGNALAWLILLFVFPFIGVALYLLVGEPRLGAARAKRTAEMNRFDTEVSERYLNDIHLAVRNDVAPPKGAPDKAVITKNSPMLDWAKFAKEAEIVKETFRKTMLEK